MPSTHRNALLVAGIGLASIAAFAGLARGGWPSAADAAAAPLERALARAEAAGTYRLSADVKQTLSPRADPMHLGARETRVGLQIAGEVQVPDRARLTWTVAGVPGARTSEHGLAPGDVANVRLLMVGDRAFVGAGKAWRMVESPLGAAGPVADYLSLLAATKDVSSVADDRPGEHYRFGLDGPAYAEHMRKRMQALMAGDLPPGVDLAAPELYKQMTGGGELWLDEAGRPQRLDLSFNLPGASAGHDAAVEARVDYSDYGATIRPIEAPAPGGPDGEWVLPAASVDGVSGSAPDVSGAAAPVRAAASSQWMVAELRRSAGIVTGAALWLGFLGLILLAVRWRRRRRVYAAIVTAVLVGMIGAPLAQAASLIQFKAAQAQRETLGTALSSLGVTPAPDAVDPVAELQNELAADLAAGLNAGPAGITDCASLPAGIVPQGDDDSDGLTNLSERCGGTDYNNPDSDSDTLSDKAELTGFTLPGETKVWTTNPLQRDSNADGMDDATEWNPDWVKNHATTLDADHDGVPNVWDEDNDGDGVLDGPDISAYKVLADQPILQLGVTRPLNDALHKDTYVYVDLQVRPTNVNHLRYTTTSLDWPYDDLGQVQELDNSTDDVQLIPMLEFRSAFAPRLAKQYGLVVQQVLGSDPHYRVLAPLNVVATNGDVQAFSARIGFAPLEVGGALSLTEMRLGWLVQAKLDSRTCQQWRNGNCITWKVNTEHGSVVSYYEPQMRITGFNVTESKNVEVGLFGVPSAPEVSTGDVADEAREVFNLVSGLGTAFLYNTQPDLDAIAARFSNPQTPPEQRWGVADPVVVRTDRYTHQDLALASTTMTATQKYLGANYTQALTPTLVLGYQEDTGSLDMSADKGVTVAGSAVTFNLGFNALLTVRQVQIQQYHWSTAGTKPGWTAVDMNGALAELARRYPTLADQPLLRYIKVLFLTWYGGQVNYVAVNGQTLVGAKADDKAIFDMLNYPGQNQLPGYVIAAYHLDNLAARINLDGPVVAWREWAAVTFSAGAIHAGVSSFIAAAGAIAVQLAPAIYFIGKGISIAVRAAASAISGAAQAAGAASGLATAAETAASVAKTIGRIAIAIAVIVAIVSLFMIWSSFHGYSDNVSHLQTDLELANNIAQTILVVLSLLLAIIIFAVAETGIGLIIELVIAVIVYLIVAIITGDWNPLNTYNSIAKWFADFLLEVAFYAQLPQNGAVNSSGLSLKLGDNTKGITPGNPVTFQTKMTTTVVVGPGEDVWNWVDSRHGNVDDVRQSSAYSRWESNNATASNQKTVPCTMVGSRKDCYTTANLTFTPPQAVRNYARNVTNVIDFSLRYQKCWWALVVRACSADSANGSGPTSGTDDYNKATSPVYLDIFPADVDGLWGWNQVSNPDRDGDAINNAAENTAGTNPNLWDSDGDRLADGWERANQNALGTDPRVADSDGDGLTDRQEYTYGTALRKADSDGDGLKDGEEICHTDGGGTFSGGWAVRLSGEARVCSSPLEGDADGDKLPDAIERTLGQSPWAPNTAPRVSYSAGPIRQHQGVNYLLVKPGDTVAAAYGLSNDTAATIETPLSVCGASATFAAPRAGQVKSSAGYTPPTSTSAVVGDQACATWDLAKAPLYTGEALSATLSAGVLGNAASGYVPLKFQLSYTDPTDGSSVSLDRSAVVTVDAELPTTTIITPTTGTAVDGTSFVTGGSAKDIYSWIDHVEVQVDGVAPWRRVTGAEAWAWTWQPLPKDNVYTFRARSTDAVGHQSPDATADIIVDNTPPGASFTSPTDGKVLTGLTRDTTGGATVTITGSATDLLSGAPKASGVAVVELSVDGAPWRMVWEKGIRQAPMTTPWSYQWRLNAGATGRHALGVRAIDALGHVGLPQRIGVVLDNVPPASLTSDARPAVPLGTAFNVPGHADETGFLPPVPHPHALTGQLDSLKDATVWLDLPASAMTAPPSLSWLGDINADGRGDLALGLPGENGGAGTVYILNGRAGGWPVPPARLVLDSPDSSLVASGATGFGKYLAPAGDVNGDGVADVAVGDPGNSKVYVVFGQTGTLGTNLDVTKLKAGRGLVLKSTNGTLGQWLAAAGDVNGDGFGDLLLGATGATGQAFLVLGRKVMSNTTITVNTDASAVLPLGAAGAPVMGVGDVNGDQFADFALGDPTAAAGNGSAVYLFLGAKSYQTVSTRNPQQKLDPKTQAAGRFAGGAPVGSQLVALGDVNGDDLADFAYQAQDAPHLVLGRAARDWGQSGTGDRTLSGLNPRSAGWLAAPGDVNADGYADFVVGATGNAAHLILGGKPLPATLAPVATLANVATIATTPFASGADCNCDGSSDLLALPPVTAVTGAPATELTMPEAPRLALADLPVAVAPAPGMSSLANVVFKNTTSAPFGGLLGRLLPGLAGSPSQAGGDVHVSAAYCPACANDGRAWGRAAFASVQAGVNSGAARVIIHPGLYRELVRLRSGVQLVGSGPEVTVLAPPPGVAPTAVLQMAGVSKVVVDRLSVTGDKRFGGISLSGGSSDITLRRLVVRDAPVGIALSGAGTRAVLVNDTLVQNSQGLVATGCATVDMRNTLFAFHTKAALSLAVKGCPASLNRYNGWWRNTPDMLIDGTSTDVSAAGQGQVPANPRFMGSGGNDFHLRPDSPMINAGDISDPPPPGTGPRVDLGAFQHRGATFYVDAKFSPTGANNGLEWGVDAFASVGDAVNAAAEALPGYGCGLSALDFRDCSITLGVAVAAGNYSGSATVPSHVAVVGAGADVTQLSGPGTGSVITLSNAAQASVAGLQIKGWGSAAGDAGVRIVGASNHVTVTHNVFVGAGPNGNGAGVLVADSANALVDHNTITSAANAIASTTGSAQAVLSNNILAFNNYGLAATGGTATNIQLQSAHNLFFQNQRDYAAAPANYAVTGGDLLGKDPQFVNAAQGDLRLQATSPAVGAGAPQPNGTGGVTDIGPQDVAPAPLALLFGQEAPTCATASSGVQTVEVGLVQVANPHSAVTSTLPTAWTTANLSMTLSTGSYWGAALTANAGNGSYRVYTRSTDAVGNQAVQYQAVYPGDGTPPTVAWRAPADGLTVAAAGLLLSAEAADIGSGVAAVYFTVDGQIVGGQSVPASRLPAGAMARYEAQVPLGVGSHRLGVVALDFAGNRATAPDRNVTISGNDIATILAPTDGSATNNGSVTVLGFARFSGATHQVALYVDDQPAGQATLADATAATSAWTAQVTLTGNAAHTLKAGVGTAPPAGLSPVTVRLDTQGPTVQASPPVSQAGGLMLSLKGQANDAGSGLALVEASFDGGYQWQPAVVTPVVGAASPWQIGWVPPAGSDGVHYGVQVRAADQAGGSASTSQSVYVDNVPPKAPQGVTLQVCGPKGCQALTDGEGLQVPGSVKVSWQLPVVDGSGPATVAAALDTKPNAAGTKWVATTNGAYTFNFVTLTAGWYYLHLLAKDTSGNTTLTTHGPYCAPKCGALPTGGGSQVLAADDSIASAAADPDLLPIVIDGDLRLDEGEWDPATQRMGEDTRPATRQELYAAWDAQDLFFGWRGALWDRDGIARIYLDVAPGGSFDPIDGQRRGLPPLPLEADLAVTVDGAAQGTVQRYTGGIWELIADSGLAYANGAEGDTELRLPRSLLPGNGPVRFVALSLGADDRPASFFPTANPLAGPWTYNYRWATLDPTVVPNAGQPGSHHLRVRLDNPAGPLSLVAPGQRFDVIVGIENVAGVPATDATLVLSTTTGLDLVAVSGGPPPVPVAPRRWEVKLGTVPATGLPPLAVTVRVADDAAGLPSATLRARLSVPVPASEPDSSRAALNVRFDDGPPHLRIWEPLPGANGSAVVQTGRVVVEGTAVDTGSGLVRVEYQVAGGAWQPATGSFAWEALVDVPAGGRVEVAVRGIDAAGLASPPVSITLVADDAPPTAVVDDLPSLVKGRTLVVRGRADDSAGMGLDSIWLQLDDGAWLSVPGPYTARGDGQLNWDMPLPLDAEEGVAHTLRARAVDEAGNEGPASAPVRVLVDNVAPHSTIAVPSAGSAITGDSLLVWGHAVDGMAVASLSVSANGGRTWEPALLGDDALALIGEARTALGGPFHAYLPVVIKGKGAVGRVTLWAVRLPLPAGPIALRTRAVDTAGNVERLGPPLRLLRSGEHWPARVWLPLLEIGG